MRPTAVRNTWRAGVCVRALGLFALLVLVSCGANTALSQPSAASPQAFSAAGIGTGTRAISGMWQFHLGDDPAWAQPSFDDSSWEQLPADQPWGDAGHPNYSGFAWYRRQIALDPNNKLPLALLLPPLESAAEVYWNGVKVGGVGAPPPHATWPGFAAPAAVPLPSTAGANTAVLAIRVWTRRLGSIDTADTGGFQAAPQLGYAPLLKKVPQQSAEHQLHNRMVANSIYLLFAFTGIVALILWSRARSQWVLLAGAVYLVSEGVASFCRQVGLSYIATYSIMNASLTLVDCASLFLVLQVSELPHRPGVRGFRFWLRVCITLCVFDAASFLAGGVELWLADSSRYLRLYHFLDLLSELGNQVFVLAPLFVIACFLLSRFTLPRLLFFLAIGIDFTLAITTGALTQHFTRLDSLVAHLLAPLFQIYGANVTIFSVDRFLLLLAIMYAVGHQINRQFARQRFSDAELKAAQEVQQVLVPAADERQAPGYSVASVYRPASEVGGDFFQIIPLSGDATLIVAGDVSGKGLRAAMTVSLVVGALRTLAEYDASPAAVLAGLNRRLIGRTQGGFVTCCAVRVDSAGHATMANAGHCQPYLDGAEIDLPSGLPLGIVAEAEYEEASVQVQQGAQLTLMSDGVVEARNAHGELYGFDRLNTLMQQGPTAEHVADSAVAFGQDDDITVVTLTRLAAV